MKNTVVMFIILCAGAAIAGETRKVKPEEKDFPQLSKRFLAALQRAEGGRYHRVGGEVRHYRLASGSCHLPLSPFLCRKKTGIGPTSPPGPLSFRRRGE